MKTIWKNHLKRFGWVSEERIEYAQNVLKIDAQTYATLTEKGYVDLGVAGEDLVGSFSVFAKLYPYITDGPDLRPAYESNLLVR